MMLGMYSISRFHTTDLYITACLFVISTEEILASGGDGKSDLICME